jgi:hypothetical protein
MAGLGESARWVRAIHDELRQDRDERRTRAEPLLAPPASTRPEATWSAPRRPWWRRLVGWRQIPEGTRPDGREVHSASRGRPVPGCRAGGSHLMNAIGRHPLFTEPTASFCRIAGVAIFVQHIAERHADLRIARAPDRRKILLAVECADVLPADLNSRELHDALPGRFGDCDIGPISDPCELDEVHSTSRATRALQRRDPAAGEA